MLDFSGFGAEGSDKPASLDRGRCGDLMHNIRRVKGVGLLMAFRKPDNQATLAFKLDQHWCTRCWCMSTCLMKAMGHVGPLLGRYGVPAASLWAGGCRKTEVNQEVQAV